jgi:CRP/FNR family transcriptional activator FtrB
MQATMRELAMAFRDTVRALTDMKLRQSAERLGNHLLIESARVGRDSFQLRSEKRLLASLLGMTPENLSRAFGALAHRGVIVEGATVRIADRVALIAFSRPDPVVDV